MICRQIFQIVSRKHLMMIQELLRLSAQFHLMITLQITRRSTRCVFCSTSEMCWANMLAIMFCCVHVSSCGVIRPLVAGLCVHWIFYPLYASDERRWKMIRRSKEKANFSTQCLQKVVSRAKDTYGRWTTCRASLLSIMNWLKRGSLTGMTLP